MTKTMNARTEKIAELMPKNGVRFQAVSYMRVSMNDAITGSHTFETQSQRIRQKLDRDLGADSYDLIEFIEDGVSGHYGPRATATELRTRKVLKAALDELRTGNTDVFIVYHINRLARNTRFFLEMADDDILPYAAFVSATEDLNMTTSGGRAMASVGAVFATMQRDSIVARNRDAAATRVQAGYYLGQVPYAWQWEPVADIKGRRRAILPIPDQGKWVVHMKDRFLSGWSFFKITAELNALGVPPPSVTKPGSNARHEGMGRPASGKWSTTIVRRTLFNPVHAGLVPVGKQAPLPGQHAPHRYFSPEERDQILAACEKRKVVAATNTGNHNDARLLNGLVHCARCGKRVHPTWHSHKKYKVYRCTNGLNMGNLTCSGVSAREDELDAAIVARVARIAQHPEMRAHLLNEAENAIENQDAALCQQRAQLTEQIARLGEDMSALIRMCTREMISEQQFRAENQKLCAEQISASDALKQIELTLGERTRRESEAVRVRELVLQFGTVWEHLGLEERREIMRQLIESLTIDRNEAGCSRTGDTRVETTVRLKLVLLPEETFPLVHIRVKRAEKPTTGLAGLTKRQLTYLHWVSEGKTGRETAEIMKISYCTVRIFEQQIRKRIGIHDMADAARAAAGMIHAKFSSLDLGGDRGPQVTKTDGGFYLSPKLMQVLPLYASGASTNEIAKMLGMTREMVGGRRHRILEMTYSKTLYEAVQKARAAGYIH